MIDLKKTVILAVMISMFVVACGKAPSEKTGEKGTLNTSETSEKATGGNRGIFQKGHMY